MQVTFTGYHMLCVSGCDPILNCFLMQSITLSPTTHTHCLHSSREISPQNHTFILLIIPGSQASYSVAFMAVAILPGTTGATEACVLVWWMFTLWVLFISSDNSQISRT